MNDSKFTYLIVGASSTGKSTIQTMLEKSRGLKGIRSYTSRPMRNENEDDTHIFVSEEEFLKLKEDMIAYTFFDGNHYGVTQKQYEDNSLYIIDPLGIKYLKEHYKGNKPYKIIYIKSSFDTRYERLYQREKQNYGINKIEELSHKEWEKVIKNCSHNACKRLNNDVSEFKDFEEKADFVISNEINDKLIDIVAKIWEFIRKNEKGD